MGHRGRGGKGILRRERGSQSIEGGEEIERKRGRGKGEGGKGEGGRGEEALSNTTK